MASLRYTDVLDMIFQTHIKIFITWTPYNIYVIQTAKRCSNRWFRKLCHFYKIFNEKSPSYLFDLLPNFNRVHNTRLCYNIPPIKVRHDYFKNSFFPSAITKWNKLDLNIRNSTSLNTFKKKLLNYILPCANNIFDIILSESNS